jgi:hypothetical protein
MRKTCCFISILCLVSLNLIAQRHFINGFLKDSITQLPIKGAKIFNTTINDIIYSNAKGFFRIQLGDGDKIIVSLNDYNSLFFTYSPSFNKDTIELYLLPLGKILPGVTISSRYNQYQIDSATRRKEFEQLRGSGLSTVSRAEGFGIAINLDRLFKQRYKNQRKNEKRFNEMEKAAYVAFRYSPHLVSYYTGLKGDDLQNFMNKNTPSYEWLRKHPENNQLLLYINDRLKTFKQTTGSP